MLVIPELVGVTGDRIRLSPHIMHRYGWSEQVSLQVGHHVVNFAVYTALLNPHDHIMKLDLPSGGHLTHGFRTPKRKVSATSVYFESLAYVVDPSTRYIDYDDMHHRANIFMPKLLIAGGSAKPLELISVTTNNNSVPGDTSAVSPGGVRVGTPALTTKGWLWRTFERCRTFWTVCVG